MTAFAANPLSPWLYRAYQTADGLPDNSITGIAQTADGYLWVATRGGLLSFNGQKFSLLPSANLALLPSRTVRAVFRDHLDRLWLGMERGPLFCLSHDGLESFTTTNGLPSQRVVMMAEDQAGAVWIVYPSQLRCILKGRVQAIHVPAEWADAGNLIATTDLRGNIWCVQGTHLGEWRDGEWKSSLRFQSPVTAITSGRKSKMWIAAGGSLLELDEGQAPVECTNLPPNAIARALLEDGAGALWIGTDLEGLFHWDGRRLERVPTSLREINCLFEDREENIWAGTEGGGLNLIGPRTAGLVGQEAGLPFESVQSVAEDAEGWLWVISQDGQLVRRKDNLWESVSGSTNWPGGNATCVAADPRAGVWVGTSHRGLKYFRDGVWRGWLQQDGLASDAIRGLMVATNGDVWVASALPNRLQQLRDGRVSVLTNAAPLGAIRGLAESPDGTIWIGTAEGQILRVSGSSLVPEPAIAEPLPVSVRSLLATADGSLWIGYAGDGLGHFKNGKYQRLTKATGLADDFVSQMLADDRGNLWINGNRGLSRLSLVDLDSVLAGRLSKLNAQVYGRLEGLPALQPSRNYCPSTCKSRDGLLWFSLHSGLLVVQPDYIHDNLHPPPVLLEQVRVDDQIMAIYNAGSPLQAHTAGNLLDLHGLKTSLHLGPNHRKMEIDFAALSYNSPENVQFRYRLSRFDADWVEAGQSRRATYPRLPAGSYEFRVIAGNNSGVWNESGANLALTVSPFFWETWWFKIGGGVVTVGLAGGSVFVVVRQRYRRKLRRLEARRALEHERARIAKDIHDDLGSSLTRISLLSQPTPSGVEDAEAAIASLAQIHRTARDLTHAMGEVVWAVNPEHDTFDSLANYLSQYAPSFLKLAGIRCRLEMPLQLPPQPVSAEVRHNLFLAFKEALNNVVKHAAASEVQIVLIPENSGFALSVADNGRGFSEGATADQTPGTVLRTTSGNGLTNMRSRLQEIGGRCELRSEPGAGTKITFRVKFKAYHEQS